MPRLEKSEKGTTDEELVIVCGPARDHAHDRPAREDAGVEPVNAEAIREKTENEGADRKSPAEDELKIAVLLFAETELFCHPDGSIRQGDPVHVIDRGREEEESGDPPFPGRGAGGGDHGFVN